MKRFDSGPPCENFREDDGKDPRFDVKSPKRVINRKALQLCAQVMDILNLTFPAMADEKLREVQVVSVIPAPDSSRLLVTLTSKEDTIEQIGKAQGFLRKEITSGINRKRAPELTFTCLT